LQVILKKLKKMKKIIFLTLLSSLFLLGNCQQTTKKNAEKNNVASESSVVHLTKESFKQKVFNYEVNKEWKYEGKIPCIVDFYASWCGPCRMISPILEDLAKEYNGKIIVYKIDTDKEQELSQQLGIQSLPTLVFVPVSGKPQVIMGALPKESLVKAINDVLLK
jgi:thioredoxin 1